MPLVDDEFIFGVLNMKNEALKLKILKSICMNPINFGKVMFMLFNYLSNDSKIIEEFFKIE